MSQENVKVVRELYELFPDLAAPPPTTEFLELFDPEVHLDQTRRVFNPASYDGQDGVLRALAELREAWEHFVLQPERFIEAGDDVVVVQSVRGRGRGSGVDVLGRSASLHTLRNGRIVRLVVYQDISEALRAAGVSD